MAGIDLYEQGEGLGHIRGKPRNEMDQFKGEEFSRECQNGPVHESVKL